MLSSSKHKNTNETEDLQSLNELDKKVLNESISYEELEFIQRTDILYKNLPVNIVTALICASVIFFTLRNYSIIPYLPLWYTAVLVISVYRVIIAIIYKFNIFSIKVSYALYLIGLFIAGTVWGIINSWLMPVDEKGQMMIVIITAGISAGSIQTLHASLIASIGFISLSTIPLAIWLFLQNLFIYHAIGITMITYYIFVIIAIFRSNKILSEVMKLQFSNTDLIKRLSHSNHRLLNRNNLLKKHEHELSLINNMDKILQLCSDLNETFPIIKSTAEILFKNINGGLTLSDHAGNQHLKVEWGNLDILKHQFTFDECWGLRSGKIYTSSNVNLSVNCHHYSNHDNATYLCIPLVVSANAIGMISFMIPNEITLTKHIKRIMIIFSDTIKFSLANIKSHETLKQEAIRDPLTNLYNRRYLNPLIEQEFQNSARNGTSFCVALLDIDYFKHVNDQFGHKAGDEFLKKISNLLANKIRKNDIVCRFGGEEFIIIFTNTVTDKIVPLLEMIRKSVSELSIEYQGQLISGTTISIGLAEAPKDGLTIDRIILAADRALYLAKESGRNKLIIAK